MMNADEAIKNYVNFLNSRSKLTDQQRSEIESTLGVLVREIIDQVKKATIVAIDAESRPVQFQSIN